MTSYKNLYTTKGIPFEGKTVDSFLDLYETIYYYESSFAAETKISSILKNGIQSGEDAYYVLAWKLGGINKNRTNADPNDNIHCNGDNWRFYEEVDQVIHCTGTYQGGVIYFKKNEMDYLERFEGKGEIGKQLNNLKEKLTIVDRLDENEANKIAAETLNLLAKDAPRGIGPVYLITLLYFLTQGKKYPIYDKFAHTALKAILSTDDIPFGGDITDDLINKDFPSKTDPKFGQKVLGIEGKNKKYIEYIKLINQFEKDFNIQYYTTKKGTNRRVDRALWSYGHMFNVNK